MYIYTYLYVYLYTNNDRIKREILKFDFVETFL